MTARPLVSTRTWAIDPSAAISAQAGVWQSPLDTLLSPPTPTIFRVPLSAYRPGATDPSGVAVRSQTYQTPTNFLPVTVVGTPFQNSDFPNPRAYTYPTDLRSFTQNIAPTNPIPSFVTGQPNPIGYQTPAANLTWINGFNENLQGSIVQPLPKNNYNHPNPVIKTWADYYTYNLNTSLGLKGITFTPPKGNQYNWPNPLLRTWSNNYLGSASGTFPSNFPPPPVVTGTFFRHFIADMGRMMST